MGKKIYIADDTDIIRYIARTFLEKEGYDVEEFCDGDALMSAFVVSPADLVVLDVMMPGSNGFVICRELRRISSVPIFMLSSRTSDLDHATARELGCDDFLTKPLEPKELISRVKNIFSRRDTTESKIAPVFSEEETAKLSEMLCVYKQGFDKMLASIQSIYDTLTASPGDNPIERFSGRIKTHGSIAGKLTKKGLDITADNARAHLTDIAGIRIISSYVNDIGRIASLIKSIPGVRVTEEQDYVTAPKPSGYRSLHLVAAVSVNADAGTADVPVEIQVRTSAMDFWAALEHKVRYKFKGHIPQRLSDELVTCANKIHELDERMYLIHDIISLVNPES
jgi:putative GTP pyrophosphokinase